MVDKPNPADETVQTFWSGVEGLLSPDDPLRARLREPNVIGIPTFSLQLQDILEGGEPYPVTPTGWRVITGTPETGLLAGDVLSKLEGLDLVSFSRDSRLANFLKQYRDVEELDRVKGAEHFSLSLLSIPGILVDAFILVSGNTTLMVPIRAPVKELELMRPYSVQEFFAKVKPLAVRFQSFNEVRPGVRRDLPQA
jgi:hypothetical protein